MRFSITLSTSYIFIILYVACSSNNTTQLEQIRMLENNIKKDQAYLNSIDMNALTNNINIAELNLLKLEDKQLDSISIELIHFQYREYLNCINNIQTFGAEKNYLKKELETNTVQLSNIKLDYQMSNKARLDLDTHLIQEAKFIQQTSNKIINFTADIKKQSENFDSLNKYIEDIINDR